MAQCDRVARRLSKGLGLHHHVDGPWAVVRCGQDPAGAIPSKSRCRPRGLPNRPSLLILPSLRQELAPRDYKRPWGLIYWLDQAAKGICWVKDLKLTMENLLGRLVTLEEDNWTSQYRENNNTTFTWSGPSGVGGCPGQAHVARLGHAPEQDTHRAM
jgi:hypothetical protein